MEASEKWNTVKTDQGETGVKGNAPNGSALNNAAAQALHFVREVVG